MSTAEKVKKIQQVTSVAGAQKLRSPWLAVEQWYASHIELFKNYSGIAPAEVSNFLIDCAEACDLCGKKSGKFLGKKQCAIVIKLALRTLTCWCEIYGEKANDPATLIVGDRDFAYLPRSVVATLVNLGGNASWADLSRYLQDLSTVAVSYPQVFVGTDTFDEWESVIRRGPKSPTNEQLDNAQIKTTAQADEEYRSVCRSYRLALDSRVKWLTKQGKSASSLETRLRRTDSWQVDG